MPSRKSFPAALQWAVASLISLAFLGCGSDGGSTGLDTGSLTVSASTSGASPDPDGYILMVDGTGRGMLSGTSPITTEGLAPGNHSVGLDGVAANCQVQGDNPRLILVASGATASVTFNVVCNEPLPSTGTIQVNISTTGADPDPDGYLATLDGSGPTLAVPVGGSALFSDVPAGTHSVAITGIAANCSADAASKSATVTAGATATVAFDVTCTAIPPETGTIRVTTATTGPNPDPDGYQFAIDARSSRSIGVNAGETVNDVPVGAHTVRLSQIAANCSADGGATQSVTVSGGQTVTAAFSVTCSALEPSASRSTMVAEPTGIVAGIGSSTIRVTVKGAGGELLSGIEVSLSASGDGNTIAPETATTNANGVATFSFSSTVAGNKTITATAGGVALDDTEVVTVFTNSSTTEIADITPEPSTSGQTFRVTVRVTGEGGNVPTGTVAIFSFQETGGCDAAALDSEGIAFCDFALDEVGTQTIEATYSGDGQFEGSTDTQDHEVVAPAGPGAN